MKIHWALGFTIGLDQFYDEIKICINTLDLLNEIHWMPTVRNPPV